MLIDQISGELQALIQEATAAGDFLALRASQEALYVIDAFKKANEDLLDTAFQRIGAERQAVLNQVRATIDEIQAGRIDTLTRLEAQSRQLNSLVRDVTFKRHPVIYQYRGSIVTPGETQDVRLSVDGYRLTRGTPHILFRGVRYDGFREGERLRFELPRSLFVADAGRMISENAQLVLERKHGGFLGLFEKTGQVTYDLNIVTLPSRLAAVELSYRTPVTQQREQSFHHERQHSSSRRRWDCESHAFNPSETGRRFDPARSSVTNGSGNSNGKIENVSIRDVGISFRICAKRPWRAGTNGYRHANVNYVEVWQTSTDETRTASGTLNWTETLSFPLQDRVDGLLVTVTDFAGVKRTIPAAGGKAGRYANVVYDAQSDVVLVNPLVPADLTAL